MQAVTLQFSTELQAPKEKVWAHLWSDAGYRQWTAAFCEGSYAESTWEEGSPIHFLTPQGHGMYSVIKRNKPFEEMTFEHLGEIKNGVKEEKGWQGALESYRLSETENGTRVDVYLGTMDEFAGYFNEAFPKALALLKKGVEGSGE